MDSGDPPPKEPYSPPDPERYDPAKWSTYFNIFLNRLTPAEQNEFREASYIKHEAADVSRVEGYRDWLFSYSPTIIFLRQQIQALNGDINEKNVLCRRCPAVRNEDGRIEGWRQGAGFSPDGGILVCANQMRDRKHLEDTLAHEMVHAWDHLRWKVDWGDLRHAACTEVCGPFSRCPSGHVS